MPPGLARGDLARAAASAGACRDALARFSQASRATVALSCPDGHLEFSVTDDGTGFDTAKATCGTGLQGMADRLAAAGGTLLVSSAPGLGTTVGGRLPVSELAETMR